MFGKIKITDFGKRHFEQKFSGTKITNKTPEEFESFINDELDVYFRIEEGKNILPITSFVKKIIPGYADFCKLIVLKNFTNAKVGSLPIDISNYQYLRHGYSARTDKELPVMSRWFELPLSAPMADYLIVIIYSKQQVIEEAEAEIKKNGGGGWIDPPDFEADWGVVGILGQTHPEEEPMQPVTMMRNALGKEEGGSGFPIDREKYSKSVDFWSKNAIVKS